MLKVDAYPKDSKISREHTYEAVWERKVAADKRENDAKNKMINASIERYNNQEQEKIKEAKKPQSIADKMTNTQGTLGG